VYIRSLPGAEGMPLFGESRRELTANPRISYCVRPGASSGSLA
jgi:hypothetical protein